MVWSPQSLDGEVNVKTIGFVLGFVVCGLEFASRFHLVPNKACLKLIVYIN